MSRRSTVLAAAAACLAVSVAVACGPDFPWQLFDNRATTLKATPANSFAYEAARLAASPSDGLQAIELPIDSDDSDMDKARIAAESRGLTEPQAAQVARMRQAPDGRSAFALGAGLPDAVRAYTAGAVAFLHDEPALAASYFEAVQQLGMPADALRATWAAYMRGRLFALDGDGARAAAGFASTRAAALAGAPDPFGLAVASLGEEARLHLQAAQSAAGDPSPAFTAELAAAVGLYANQAAHGSSGAVESLRMVAETLFGIGSELDPARLRAAVSSPIVQRLLVAYALARIDDDPPAGSAAPSQPNPLLGRLLDAIQAAGAQPQAADRLAALCYRTGRYDLAARLAAKAGGPLAAWVRAKLALQRGDQDAAAAAYAEAARAFPDAADAPLDDANRRLVVGERGTLTLARGDYREAMAELYPVAGTYWGDVAYIAERVLTADELKRFVDTNVPTPTAPVTAEARSDDRFNWLAFAPAAQLRDLLGRRLAREGRYQEASAYLHAPADTAFTDPEVRAEVAAYAAARQDAAARWWRVDRARAWYTAAVLARSHGMEMMGYEAAPDYFGVEGAYDGGLGQTQPGDAFVSPGERTRFAASAAVPDLRFHYRFRAVEDASRAADLLPPRSQAFAAVLCQATGWMMSSEGMLEAGEGAGDRPKEANPATLQVHALYARYIRQGAHLPWAAHFGQDCPEPDFEAAERTARWQYIAGSRTFAHQHKPELLTLAGIAMFGLAWAALRRRGRRSAR